MDQTKQVHIKNWNGLHTQVLFCMESKLDHQVSFFYPSSQIPPHGSLSVRNDISTKSWWYLAMQSTILNARMTSKLATNISINLFFGTNICYAIIKDSSRSMRRIVTNPSNFFLILNCLHPPIPASGQLRSCEAFRYLGEFLRGGLNSSHGCLTCCLAEKFCKSAIALCSYCIVHAPNSLKSRLGPIHVL